jgi:hypothetical protein
MFDHPKTHRLIKGPQMSARSLADFMAASETARRSIVQKQKFQAIARVIQHGEAKVAVARFLRGGGLDPATLEAEAAQLRARSLGSDFEREQLEHNAAYIERFATNFRSLVLPEAEIIEPGPAVSITLKGVKVTLDLRAKLRRRTRTNKLKIGALTLRYSKGKPLPVEVGCWQSALLIGGLKALGLDEGTVAENQLCLTIDAWSGIAYPAPTDATRRFNDMTAACASIAERWDKVPPPKNAVL